MGRVERWIAFVILVGTFIGHAAFPRYQVTLTERGLIVRFDRWTGRVEQSGGVMRAGWDGGFAGQLRTTEPASASTPVPNALGETARDRLRRALDAGPDEQAPQQSR
jgi:hypothetical protein